MITIDERVVERSSAIFDVVFADEDDVAATPKTMTWTLTDAAGTVVNARQQVVVAAPAASVSIVLFGADLQILSTEAGREAVNRRLIIEATYDSTLGSDLPVKQSAGFVIENLQQVA